MNKKFLQKALLLLPSVSYRSIAYFATVMTGFCALASQVIWQKHLAILTGSEARSLSLVIAVFLLGLAIGYYVFGLLTEKKDQARWLLLKYYGYVELLTGLYIGFFPFYFELLKYLSFHSPNSLIIDILISCLALLLPSFLMGASIPLLTAVLPQKPTEVNTVHAKIYGWNTVGACLGALLSGLYLIPKLGLDFSLTLLGGLNFIAGMIFLSNKLSGSVQKQEEPPAVPSPLPNSFFMLFVFFTGALIISLEVICVKILNVSIGAGVYNFPFVLSIFVGALALGSLSIKKQKISINFFIRQLFIILFFLQILFLTAPYWSIWLNNIRVSLSSIPSNYLIYNVFVFLFLSLFLFPTVFFMGRLLPLAYMFLNKTKKNYGKVCGFLYFFNTLGTVFGAIVIGYLAFYFLNLDIILKINIYIFFLLSLTVILYKKNTLDFVILSVLGLTLLLLPTQWNRNGHELGYFKIRNYDPELHFRDLFFIPKNFPETSNLVFFKDGPNSTVSLIQYSENLHTEELNKLKNLFTIKPISNLISHSIVVNGKSDSNSVGDFSTLFFMLPYLHSSTKDHLDTAFIGLGTGISAGAYTPLKDVKSIEVLEISPFVIKAIESAPPDLNFNLMTSKKLKIVETDAFKHFTKGKKPFDIIVSEPSNPYVLGVENLFTVEFYELVIQSLNEGGIFGQWIHTYEIDLQTLEIIIKTINHVFPYAKVYKVGHKDLLIIAGKKRIKALSEEKFNQPFIKKFYKIMGVRKLEDLYLSQVLSQDEFKQVARLSSVNFNSITQPQLIYRTNKTFFLGTEADLFSFINKLHPSKKIQTEKMKVFNKRKLEDWSKKCARIMGFNFLCVDMLSHQASWKAFKNKENSYTERFIHYIALRKQGLIPYDEVIMNTFFNESIKNQNMNLSHLSDYISEKIKLRDYEGADQDATTFKNKQLITEQHYNHFKADLKNTRKIHKSFDQN